jgi:hypothetical protein
VRIIRLDDGSTGFYVSPERVKVIPPGFEAKISGAVTEVVAEGGKDPFRPTGIEIFNAKSPAEQDAMLGPKAAEAVRAGSVGLEELVQRSPLDSDQPDYITQKPLPQEGD